MEMYLPHSDGTVLQQVRFILCLSGFPKLYLKLVLQTVGQFGAAMLVDITVTSGIAFVSLPAGSYQIQLRCLALPLQ